MAAILLAPVSFLSLRCSVFPSFPYSNVAMIHVDADVCACVNLDKNCLCTGQNNMHWHEAKTKSNRTECYFQLDVQICKMTKTARITIKCVYANGKSINSAHANALAHNNANAKMRQCNMHD